MRFLEVLYHTEKREKRLKFDILLAYSHTWSRNRNVN